MTNELTTLSNRIAQIEPLGWEEAVTIGQQLRHLKELSQWAIGDLARRVIDEFGSSSLGKFAYAIGLEKKTVWEYMRVAENYLPDTRNDMLSFRHHQIALQGDNPTQLLTEANDNNWTTRELYEAVKGHPTTSPHQHEWVTYRRCLICGEYEQIEPALPGNHRVEALPANHISGQPSSSLVSHAYLTIRTPS